MTDLKKLREIAKMATPGPWRRGNAGAVWTAQRESILAIVGDGSEGNPGDAHDANHITAFNPKTALALLDQLELTETKMKQLEADHKLFRERLGPAGMRMITDLRERAEKAEYEVEEMVAGLTQKENK